MGIRRRARRSASPKRDRPSADRFHHDRASKLDYGACALKPRGCAGADAAQKLRKMAKIIPTPQPAVA
ncbi:hypothetical protein Sala_2278 [Sphingopyxis alaskensis RB2256]|jgi:hypothetical protein|uniref:Uncharacterized protein n=1 Tax=Sphingopyxis alaskensis (strain DSM 13593 / LMG 18877 / RB2256) TaxID=317655 RepID=Q1GQT5_SPHAL|nr:hypothetical protein Sala_2278 [Sphingopyxis alaskensis RB2256]